MRLFKFLLLEIVIVFFAASYSVAAGKKILIVAESFPPFEYVQDGRVVGIDIDIITHVFGKLGIDFKVRILPWTRAWNMIEYGDADAVLSTSRKEKRKLYLYYPKEDMWTSEYVFFVRKDKKTAGFNGYEDAKSQKLKIGIIRGNSYHKSFWETFPERPDGSLNRQLDPAKNVEINFKKLQRGRIDLYILDKTVGLYSIKLLKFQDEITYYEKVLFSKGYPMPFARKSKIDDIDKIADQFEHELIKMKQDGEYNKIIEHWTRTD